MRIIFLAILALFSAPAGAQTFGETRQYFGDWLAACRPTGYCSATAYDNLNPPSGAVADNILRIGRHPTATYWEVSLATVSSMPAQFTQLFFSVDGAQTTFEQNFGYGAYSSINEFFLVSSEALTIIDQMAAGNKAVASFQNLEGGQTDAPFSLTGLSAALLWIDEQQSRIGSERVAYAAPIGLTPVSTEFPQAVPTELIVQRTADVECDPFEDLPGAHRVIVDQVDEEYWIYLIPCTSGAYNLAYKAYEGNGTYFAPIYFAEFSETGGWGGNPIIINPVFNKDTNVLTSHYLGRGIGDCGNSGTWVWDTENYRFAMLEFRLKEACDATGEPGVFPIVFQLEPQPTLQKPK